MCLLAGPWLSKYNFLGLGSIEFKVIAFGPLFDMLEGTIHHCLGLCRSAGPCDLYNGATYVLIFLANRHILWACDLYYGATYNPENMVVVVIVINNVVHIRCVPYRSYFNVTQFSLLHIFLNYI